MQWTQFAQNQSRFINFLATIINIKRSYISYHDKIL